MTKQEQEQRLIEAIFGPASEQLPDNGSDGIDDDPFAKWESPEAADLYA